MNRRLFIALHLYLASFFASAVVLVAVSGGLYLLDIKGTVKEIPVASLPAERFSLPVAASKQEVAALLAAAGVTGFDFEYVRQSGKLAYTRPTSKVHYLVDGSAPALRILRREPDLQARMIELHKGHGPSAFKTFQKAFALGLLFIILSGLWLGLSAPRLVLRTALAFSAGLILFLGLILA